jgi:hypothetical protein
VHRGGVLHDHHVIALGSAEAELGDRGGAVSQQPHFVLRISPGPGHDLHPVHRPDLRLIPAGDLLDEPLGHQPSFGQQRLKRRIPLLNRRHRSRVVRAVAHAGSR